MTTDNDEKTRLYNNDEEATRLTENTEAAPESAGDESTRINPAAPVSKKAASKSQWASRLGFGAAGAAAGFAAGYAVSANASDNDTGVKGLATAATPDDELPAGEKPTDEDVNITINDDASADVNNDDENLNAGQSVAGDIEEPSTPSAANNNFGMSAGDDHIVGQNTVVNGPTGHTARTGVHTAATEQVATEQPVTAAPGQAAVEPDSKPLAQDDIRTAFHHETAPQPEPGTVPEQSEIIIENNHGIGVAHVDDSMSFGEAFAAARAQVGAPGVFEWHGNVYGTYYAEEWNDMSLAERTDFIRHADFGRETPDMTADVAVADEVPADPMPEMAEATVERDNDLEVIDITSTMDSDGDISTTAHLNLQGNDVYMTDQDGDGIMDIAITDIDGDGRYDENIDVVEDISEHNITVDDVVEEINGTGTQPEPQPEPEIEIVEVNATMAGDGSMTSSAHMTVDGTDVYMIDQDGDNIMDVMIVDADSNGELTDSDVVIDITDQNIAINDIISEMTPDMTVEPDMTDDMAMTDFDPNSTPDF